MLIIIKNLLISVFITVAAGIFVFLVSEQLSHADEMLGFDLQELSVGYKSFFPGGSDPLITENGIPNRTLGKELELTMNTNLLSFLYWNNLVHGSTDEIIGSNGKGQFRLVGYKFEIGVRPFSTLEVFYQHHSQHLLDTVYAYGHWPVSDSVGIRIYLYKKGQ